jgi:drug/metabolite transporter (DMT)-like permease
MNGELRPHAAALAAVVLWGLSFIATKAVLAEIPPTTVVFTRFLAGSLILLSLLPISRRSRSAAGIGLPKLFVLGFFGIFVHQMLQVFGLRSTTATSTGWLIGLVPIWAAVLAAIFLAERLSRPRIVGLLLGLVGASLIVGVGPGAGGFDLSGAGLGDLLILISTLNWAAYTVYIRVAASGGSGLRTAAYSMCLGCLMLAVPFSISAGWNDYASLSPGGWAALLFLGVGCSGLAYFCWAYALERLQTSRVAAYLYVEPFVTQVAAALLLDESVGAIVPLGGTVVLCGVFLVQGGSRLFRR